VSAPEFVDHGKTAVVKTEHVTIKCGNPGCKRDAKYHLDYGDGLLRCAMHLGSMVRFALIDRDTVCVTRL
jgi:hypothetical protein